MTFNPAWKSEELAREVCDALTTKGLLKKAPAFFRTDREAKLAAAFSSVGLDGAKMQTIKCQRELEVLVRQGTQGEVWVQDVIQALVDMRPDVATSAVTQNNPSPKFEVKVVSLSGSEMVLKLAPGQGREALLRRVQSEWPLTRRMADEYRFFKGDAELKQSDVLKDGDVITAVVSQLPGLAPTEWSRFASSIKALDLQPMRAPPAPRRPRGPLRNAFPVHGHE